MAWDLFKEKIKQNRQGLGLVEAVVSIAIVALLFLGVFSLINYSIKLTAENKFRLGALMVADQKMEKIRNLPYDDVGTEGGIVHGVIPDNETITNNNGVYYVNTYVQYKDDPYDGLAGGNPDDTLPTDYKEVRIRVSWQGPFGQKSVENTTIIAPRGMETSAGGGTLSILVFDANGLPVEEANIHIVNNSLSPVINFDAETNSYGRLNLPGAPESIEGYGILVTKSGYSTASTSARSTENPNPTHPYVTVLEGQKTEVSFAIDRLSTLDISTVQASLPQNWPVNTDNSGQDQTNVRLAIDNNGFIYFVWQDYRQTSASKIYAQKYNSSGQAQWPNPAVPADQVIATQNNTTRPDIKIDRQNNLLVAWDDNSVGNKEVYLTKLASADGSEIWGGAKKINTAADNADQFRPRLALSPGTGEASTTIVWVDNRNTDNDIYAQRLSPDGNQVWTAEVRVNSTPTNDGTNQTEPAIAIDQNDYIYIAWTDNRSGNNDIYLASLYASGTVRWSDKMVNTDASGQDQTNPDIGVDPSGNIWLVWTDNRNDNLDIYAQRLSPDGNHLWSQDVRVNTDTSTSTAQYSPAISFDLSGNAYVVWVDEREGNPDIYAQKLDPTAGTHLWDPDIRINVARDVASDTADQINPALAVDPSSGAPYAAWQSNAEGDNDLFATSFDNYYSNLTYVGNVPVFIHGIKQIGDNPVIYKYSQTSTSTASGRLILSEMEWDSYYLSLDSGYTAKKIIMANPSPPIDLPPNTNLKIMIFLE